MEVCQGWSHETLIVLHLRSTQLTLVQKVLVLQIKNRWVLLDSPERFSQKWTFGLVRLCTLGVETSQHDVFFQLVLLVLNLNRTV